MYRKILDDLKDLKSKGIKFLKVVPYIIWSANIWGDTSLYEIGFIEPGRQRNRDFDNTIKVINSLIGGKASYSLEYDEDEDEVVGVEIVCTPRIPKLDKVESTYTEMGGAGDGKNAENDAK